MKQRGNGKPAVPGLDAAKNLEGETMPTKRFDCGHLATYDNVVHRNRRELCLACIKARRIVITLAEWREMDEVNR